MSSSPPQLPDSEANRLALLRSYEILDTSPEEDFDDLTRIASQVCGTPIALVSLIDKDRQWFKSKVGIDAVQTPRDQAFCAHAILKHDEVFEIGDAKQDPRFANNPLVTGEPNIRFYAGVPLVTDSNEALGTLCVIDRTPRELTPEQRVALQALSRQVMRLMQMRRALVDIRHANDTLQRYQRQLEGYQRQIEQSNVRLRVSSSTDPLTGLANRAVLRAELDGRMDEFARKGTLFSLLLLDVDHFKSYNDTYGHPAGDEVLKQVASVLLRNARERDVAVRYGGEEFALLVAEAGVSTSCLAAERCRYAIETADWPNRQITVSVGAATFDGTFPADVLVQEADRALYASKRDGRNRISHAGDVKA